MGLEALYYSLSICSPDSSGNVYHRLRVVTVATPRRGHQNSYTPLHPLRHPISGVLQLAVKKTH